MSWLKAAIRYDGKINTTFSDYVILAAKHLGIKDIKRYWQKNKVKGYRFVNFEAALLRLGKDYYHKNKKFLVS